MTGRNVPYFISVVNVSSRGGEKGAEGTDGRGTASIGVLLEIVSGKQIGKQTCKQTCKQIGKQTCKQMSEQIDKLIDT